MDLLIALCNSSVVWLSVYVIVRYYRPREGVFHVKRPGKLIHYLDFILSDEFRAYGLIETDPAQRIIV